MTRLIFARQREKQYHKIPVPYIQHYLTVVCGSLREPLANDLLRAKDGAILVSNRTCTNYIHAPFS